MKQPYKEYQNLLEERIKVELQSGYDENKEKKEDLNKLYALSKYRKFTVCAPDDNSLNNIIEELTKRGFVYNE